MTFRYSDASPLRLPSLELAFLPLSLRKGVDLPEIAFVESEAEIGCSGYYDASTGRLVVAVGDGFESSLAHEWRHHWQHQTGHFDTQNVAWVPDSWSDDYWASIERYFSFQPHEYDALLFSLALPRPCPLTEEWLIHCQRSGRGLFAAPSTPRMQ